MKKISKSIIIIICLFAILVIINILFGNKIILRVQDQIINRFAEDGQISDMISYKVYDNTDINNIKILVLFKNDTGIKRIIQPNGKILECNGKNQVAIDYVTSLEKEEIFQIKLLNNQEGECKIRTTAEEILNGVAVTAEQIAADPKTYYGARVTNYTQGANYRIFYVDTEDKYGDGKNTVYLIADYDDSRTSALGTYASSKYTAYAYDANKTKIREMNPTWSSYIGSTSSWNENAKSAAYLCDTSKWTTYYDSTKANYVIGSPSLEMYVDSYNQTHNANSLVYTCTPTTGTSRTNSGSGYFIGANGSYSDSGCCTDKNTVDTAQNGIYMETNKYFWLASPSACTANIVSFVNGRSARVDYYFLYDPYGVRPLVSLQSNIPIKIEL